MRSTIIQEQRRQEGIHKEQQLCERARGRGPPRAFCGERGREGGGSCSNLPCVLILPPPSIPGPASASLPPPARLPRHCGNRTKSAGLCLSWIKNWE